MKTSRRDFLVWGASAGAGAAIYSLMSKLEPLSAAQLTGLSQPSTAGKKWVFVIDLDRCNGCAKCTEACIAEMQVPPAWGQPEFEGRQPWIQVFSQPSGGFLVAPCQNCQNAPCAKVCPVGATFYSEDHIVLIDQDRCIGCRICLAACPYERRFFNWFDPPITEEEKQQAYSVDSNTPHRRGVVEKCIWCRHRLLVGKLPACVEGCTRAGMKALWFGDSAEDVVANSEDVTSLSELLQNRGAYRLKDELGTLPSVLYLPPRSGVTP